MIDLHILHHPPSTRPEWWRVCLESAKAAEAAGLVTLHVVDAQGDNIGASRAEAFERGHHPFVSYLDDDDILVPQGIPYLLAALAQYPEVCGVYSDRQQIDAEGNILFTLPRGDWSAVNQLCGQDFPHMLAVYRREALIPHLDAMATSKTYCEFISSALSTQFGPWRHVPVLAYQRRENDYYINHVRRIDPETARKARAMVIPALKPYLIG